MKSRRRWWAIYAICAITLVLALAWISSTVMRLEKAEHAARADAERGEAIRLALWRMDSAIAPLIIQENARPYFDYNTFNRASTWNPADVGEVNGDPLIPSPLLSHVS